MKLSQVTYIWIDGTSPTQTLRCKTKVIPYTKNELNVADIPQWNFDGSSTYQALGHDSDLTLQAVCLVKNPLSKEANDYLALCEVLNPDGTPHMSNNRARLVKLMEQGGKDQDPWIGFEQEYTFFKV